MADKAYYNYGRYMDWGSWKAKRFVPSPAAINYPKTKILKMLKDNYVPNVAKVIKTTMKKPPKKAWHEIDWDDFDDFFDKLAK